MASIANKTAQMCSGCLTCVSVCPVKAICSSEDAHGFTVPKVDADICIDCGKCTNVCHMNKSDGLKQGMPKAVYAAYDIDAEALKNSASGGAANCISRAFVSNGGIVFGCEGTRHAVKHVRVEEEGDLKRLQGSKYVQSDIAGAVGQMAEDLKQERKVLFVGTPCQVAAVRLLFKDAVQLYTIDLICEGVPSFRLYDAFLCDLEKSLGVEVGDFRFRDKRKGWSTKFARVVAADENASIIQRRSADYYYYWLFIKGLILRDSCYACPYAMAERVGDVTVGDYWGVESSGVGLSIGDMKKGVSLVLVNSSKGAQLLELLKENAWIGETSLQHAIANNGCLRQPTNCNLESRKRLFNRYAEEGTTAAFVEYWESQQKFRGRLISKLKDSVSYEFKARLKMIIGTVSHASKSQ